MSLGRSWSDKTTQYHTANLVNIPKETIKDGSEKCGICNKTVSSNDFGIQCSLCQVWYHIKCENITAELYKVTGKVSKL